MIVSFIYIKSKKFSIFSPGKKTKRAPLTISYPINILSTDICDQDNVIPLSPTSSAGGDQQ